MSKRIRTAIESILSEKRIEAAYGFGSFFRDEAFNDIDVLIVLDGDSEARLKLFDELQIERMAFEKTFSITLDLTFLTSEELSDTPSFNVDKMVQIYPFIKD